MPGVIATHGSALPGRCHRSSTRRSSSGEGRQRWRLHRTRSTHALRARRPGIHREHESCSVYLW